MKKHALGFILLTIVIVFFHSCTNKSEKVIGSYKGMFNNNGFEVTITVTAGSSNDKVNMSASAFFNNKVLTDVNLTSSGEIINFSYSSGSTQEYDVTNLAGSLNGNTLSITLSRNYSGGTSTEIFSGTKQ